MKSAFEKDNKGYFAYQDPDEDLDWTFDFKDDDEPALRDDEEIAAVEEMILTRVDGVAIAGTELHDPEFDAGKAKTFVRNLVLGKTYNLECTIRTTAVPPRKFSRSFRLICKER